MTHMGPLLGTPPTGKHFELKGVVIWRIANGRICERRATLDHLGVCRTAGAASCT